MDLTDHNILFITLDSCRFDTAQKASTPNLDSIGQVRPAETYATYTSPAHHAFFIGKLPLIRDQFYLYDYEHIWRSSDARAVKSKTLVSFSTPTIIEHYQNSKYQVQGFGGVRFFNTYAQTCLLPNFFKNFTYFGYKDAKTIDDIYPRDPKTFPLNNIEKIVNTIDTNKNFFIFINSPETHFPFIKPENVTHDEFKELILRFKKELPNKTIHTKESLPFTKEEIENLKQSQVVALEEIDKKLGELFSKLRNNRPTIVIVCGDHGEEFGEGGRFGHSHPHETVFNIPFWIGVL